ncbi:probable protein phosphatase 2C 79 [Salvia hispanica]|uniref:probable protein phosphatase 2C 79 n=1 Tax=Salvia hispanica TaxID=49212 RepID=UPI0020097F16|nr:probable protein phosphatase 2C 79 [Salvia hispanica]
MLLPGTCCVVCVVCEGWIYICNIGDSRAVMGTLDKPKNQVQAVFKQMAMPKKGIQPFTLTVNHSNEELSGINDFQTQHIEHPVTRCHFFHVKDYIRTSRILGCAFLKSQDFNKRSGLSENFRLREDMNFPVFSLDPWIHSQKLKPENKFIIFATHGLWDNTDEKKAVEIVNSSPQHGIARLLINHALKKKAPLANRNLQNQEAASSRSIQEEISVFVLFLDHQKLTSNKSSSECPSIDIRTYGASSIQPSPDEASSSGTKEANDTKEASDTEGASSSLWKQIGSSFMKFT